MRLSLAMPLETALGNKRKATMLKHFGMRTVADALTYYPFRVTDPLPLTSLRDAASGQAVAVHARVLSSRAVPFAARRGTRVIAVVEDDTATAELVFFSRNQGYSSWMLSRLSANTEIVFNGSASVYNNVLQFTHPDIQVIGHDAPTPQAAINRATRPRPVYHASARYSTDRIHEQIVGLLTALALQDGLMNQATPASTSVSEGELVPARSAELTSAASELSAASEQAMVSTDNLEKFESQSVPSILPQQIREKNQLMSRFQALVAIHNPQTTQEFYEGLRTMRFEEAFVSQTSLLHQRRQTEEKEAFPCPEPSPATGLTAQGKPSLVARLRASLPFTLTPGQEQVLREISTDMALTHPMQRLLQGEVGSGKTLVALLSMLQAVDAGYQAVLVAPTQVLAEQHYENIRQRIAQLEGADLPPVVLLTGALKQKEKRENLALVASGEPCLVIATHAAFSTHFQAPRMALAIIDEQHRFGVEQRDTLLSKAERTPHLLVMTATPIPRTAAMTWFGDLELSELKGLPSGRQPIRTHIIPEANGPLMAQVFQHVRARIEQGERAYIICPAIDSTNNAAHRELASGVEYFTEDEEDAGMDAQHPLHSVTEIQERLSALPQFAGIKLATLTGRDDEETKNQVMADFESGAAPVLVATTVIEVGVDVKQASCIVIFDANHFGLTQLHQLRGRVGRGGTQGWCFLISTAEPGSLAEQRLKVIQSSHDGAQIAQADIELRGVGDVLGDAQSGGKSSFKLLRVVKDAAMIESARKQARDLLQADSNLTAYPQLMGAVLDFLRANEKYLTKS